MKRTQELSADILAHVNEQWAQTEIKLKPDVRLMARPEIKLFASQPRESFHNNQF